MSTDVPSDREQSEPSSAGEIEVPPSWRSSVEQIQRRSWRKILVLGASDRGKSTYCQYLSQQLLAAGETVAVVDADVGQKDIGAPAAITLGYPREDEPWTRIKPAAWSFVGDVSPVGHFLAVVLGTQKLVGRAQAKRVIINTTGFVHGAGRELKGYKIEAIQPDVMVSLAWGRELRSLFVPYPHIRTLRVTPSSRVRRKTPEQRRINRERAFRDYFRSAREIQIPRSQLAIQHSLLFSGTPISHPSYLYAERTAEGLIAVGEPASTDVGPEAATTLPVGFERSLLCGVADRRQRGLGLAILQHICFETTTFYLKTPTPVAEIRHLQLGHLYLNSDGQELGRFSLRH